MPRKLRYRFQPSEEIELLEKAALMNRGSEETDGSESINDISARIQTVLKIIDNNERRTTDMLFFVMYDIENNKIRRYIVKYLLRKGCHRVQKSIFLASLPPDEYRQIKDDLSQARSCYEGDDSIFIVPISTEYLKSMSILGKSLRMDVIMKNKNTLFF